MEQADFMIGDWVHHSPTGENWQWKATDYLLKDSTMCEISLPVLTKEMFINNGFKETYERTCDGGDYYYFKYEMFEHSEDYSNDEYDEDAFVKIYFFENFEYTGDEPFPEDDAYEPENSSYSIEFGSQDLSLRFYYVYELQHFLRLLGFKKLANNFKIN